MENFDFSDLDINERMIAENNLAFSFLNKMPITPGHTLICPKRPLTFSHDLTQEELYDIFLLKEQVCKRLKRALHIDGFNFAWNEGSLAGQSVPHFHLHVVPRKKGDSGIYEYEPRVFLYRPGSRADSPHTELVSFANELRNLT